MLSFKHDLIFSLRHGRGLDPVRKLLIDCLELALSLGNIIAR